MEDEALQELWEIERALKDEQGIKCEPSFMDEMTTEEQILLPKEDNFKKSEPSHDEASTISPEENEDTSIKRPHRCLKCDKKFTRAWVLKVHEKTHWRKTL